MNQSAEARAQSAMDELARTVLSDYTMDELLRRIADLAKGALPGAEEVSISLISADSASTVVSTGDLATALDEAQYAHGTGPCMDAASGGQVAFIPDMRAETRWPAFVTAAVTAGCLSSLSTPIPIQQYGAAALNMYCRRDHGFDGDSLEVATSFAGYAAVALANMHLYESAKSLADQLKAAMASRAVIEQAKGVLMSERGCDANAAFNILVRLSQDSNRKLRDVAEALVTLASQPPSHMR